MKIKNILLALIISLPLGGIAQKRMSEAEFWKDQPIVWQKCRAVRADETHYDFFLECYLKKGWEIYAPNRKDKCPLSPTIVFDKRPGVKPIGDIEVIEGIEADTLSSDCPISRYRNHVTFIQTFEMSMGTRYIITGEVNYEPISRFAKTHSRIYGFHLRIGDTLATTKLDSISPL